MLNQLCIRIKRKREGGEDILPSFVLPHNNKRSKNQDISSLLENVDISNSIRKGFLCELVTEQSSLKRKNSRDDEDVDEDVGSITKRKKIVDLEHSNGGLGRVAEKQTGDPEAEDMEMDYAIWHAFRNGEFHLIQDLVQRGHDVNYQRHVDGVTSLMAASSNCETSIIEMLLGLDANAHLFDVNGFDAIAHLGTSCLENKKDEEFEKCLQLLQNTEFVYDVYHVSSEVALQEDGEVWKSCGATTAWHKDSIPVAIYEFDIEELQELIAQDHNSEVSQSDLENPDDENYLYNDYPEEEVSSESSYESDQDDESDSDYY